MANTDINSATITDLENQQPDYSVDTQQLDSPQDQDETSYYYTDFSKWLGYYKTIPELNQAIKALAIWTAGKGWTSDPETTVRLKKITGWGEDTFQSIMENMIIVKKVNGDAFAEIIRNKEKKLINLKPLSPANLKVVVNRQGVVRRYEQINKSDGKTLRKFQPEDILHLCNDRIGDEIHGESVVAVCEEVILARNEAITDWRKVLHRNINPLKIFNIDEDDEPKLDTLKAKYHKMTKDYEAIFVPLGNMTVDIPAVPLQNPTEWIRYLENFFYQAVGVPKIILGGSQEFTEASSKVGYLTFEQIYMREQRELEGDLWNQLALEVTFERPVSLKDQMVSDEAANTGQVGFQPKETNINMERE